jgi:hypothetical protein
MALRGVVLLGTCSKFGSEPSPRRLTSRSRVLDYSVGCRAPRNHRDALAFRVHLTGSNEMNAIIYLVGLVVIVMFILSFLGLR